MVCVVIYYPNVETPHINQFRKKYDPQVDLIAPHITLMFPVSESIGEDNLVHHLEKVLCNWQPFRIHLQGVHISADDHVFLILQEGNADVIRLHDEIYTGILIEYRRADMTFIPHVTLGVVEGDSSNRERVLEEVKQLGIDHRCVLDKLHLLKVNDDRSGIVWSKEFALVG